MFEKTTDCDACQAIRDGQDFFCVVEEIAIEHNIEPSRMALALRELHAGWYAVIIEAFPELDIEPDTLGDAFNDSLTHYIKGTGHTHQ